MTNSDCAHGRRHIGLGCMTEVRTGDRESPGVPASVIAAALRALWFQKAYCKVMYYYSVMR